MRSRYLTALVFAVAMSLVFVSCDSFFTNNLFKSAGLGQVSAEKLQSESSAQLVDDAYTDGQPSTAFFDTLAADPATKDQVLGTLEATYASPTASPAEVQDAASLAAQIEIVTTGGDELVNNLATHYGEFHSITTVEGAIDLVQSLIPEGLGSDETAFTAAIDALISADKAFDALGGSMLANNGLAAGVNVNVGTAAQSALAAAALVAVDVSAITDPGTGVAYASKAAYLWDVLHGITTKYPASFSLDTSASTPLGSILAGAGLTIDPIKL